MQLHLQVLVITAITSTVCDLTNNGPTQILFQFEMSLKTFFVPLFVALFNLFERQKQFL